MRFLDMADTKIPDFTDSELWLIRTTLRERYGTDVPLELGTAELRLRPEDRAVTPCPLIFWAQRGANFVVCKTGPSAYRCQFYYRGFEQYGTGRDIYDDLGHCLITLLQVQSDHERRRNAAAEGKPPESPKDGAAKDSESEDSYKYQPLFWGD